MPTAPATSFDPDVYLRGTGPAFDPDAYLAGDKPSRTNIKWEDGVRLNERSGGDFNSGFTALGGEMGETPYRPVSDETMETALRVGLPLLAAGAAPFSGGASLLLGGAGAFTGEVMAQESEMERGAREKASYGRMVAAPAIAAIPLGPAASAGKQIFGPAGQLLATAPQAILKRGAFGGAIGAGASAVEQAIDTGKIDLGQVADAALFNAAFGAIMGGVETVQMTRFQKQAMLELRKRTGQWQSSDLEFKDYLLKLRQRGPQAATAPAEEGAAVPQEQIQVEPAGYTEQPTAPVAPVAPAPEPPAVAGTPAVLLPPTTAAEPTVPVAAPVESQNMPEWTREEMIRRGLDPARPLNDVDITNPSIQDAVQADPTLTTEQKENVLKTGSPQPFNPDEYLAEPAAPVTEANAELLSNANRTGMVFPTKESAMANAEENQEVRPTGGGSYEIYWKGTPPEYIPPQIAPAPAAAAEMDMVNRGILPKGPHHGIPFVEVRAPDGTLHKYTGPEADELLRKREEIWSKAPIPPPPDPKNGWKPIGAETQSRAEAEYSASFMDRGDPYHQYTIGPAQDGGFKTYSRKRSEAPGPDPEEQAANEEGLRDAEQRERDRKTFGNPHDTSATSDRLNAVRKTKPRPITLTYGKHPTSAQVAGHNEAMDKWNSAYRKATKEHKQMVEKSNEWLRQQKEAAKKKDPIAGGKTEKEAIQEYQRGLDEAMEDYYQDMRDSVGKNPVRVSAEKIAKDAGIELTPEAAKARVDKWKAFAAELGKSGKNGQKIILSLFDSTGEWSKPFRDAGFQVVQIDLNIVNEDGVGHEMDVMEIDREWLEDNGLDMVHGVLAACPCTEFSGAGALWWAEKEKNDPGITERAKEVVSHTLAIIEYLQPDGFWALEQPVGRTKDEAELPIEQLQFQPHNYGDPFTKRTQIFGVFNPDLPQANVFPSKGSFAHNLRGDKPDEKALRSQTFEGFAYSFFMANHDRDAMATAEAELDENLENVKKAAKTKPAKTKKAIAPEPVAVPEPPPAATVKQTEDGPVIAPTQREDVRVSKLVDRKQFKVQREYLLDAAKKALAVAPESATDYITFEVPGDGTFKVMNNQVRLKAFVDIISKRFGKPFQLPSSPGVGGKVIKTTVHSPFSEPVTSSREAPGPRPVPALKTKPTVEDVTEAVKLAASTDPTRYALAEVVNENGFTVATDGRRLYLATGGGGTKLGADRDLGGKAGRYPNWKQALPSWIKADNGKITVGKAAPQGMFHVLTAEAIRTINQAINATGEKIKSVFLYKLGSGKIGMSSADPSFGDYRSEGVTEDMKAITSVNPQYLRDALAAARMTGNDAVKLYIAEGASPVVVIGGDNFVAVTMPTRGKGNQAFQHPKIFAGEEPGPSRRKEHETNIANAKHYAETEAKTTAPRASAAGSVGFAAGSPGPGNFGQGVPPPADNPAFTQVPFQLPELVELTKAIMGGRVPRVVENIRLHQGRALGVFRYKEGTVDSGKIELKADVFHFLSQDEKDKLMRDAVAWATAQQFANPNLNMHEAIKAKFHELVREAEAEAMKRDPIHALYVLSHELWHAIDFLPDGTLRRGNILGHMAAFKHYLEGYLPAHPGFMGDWTTFPTDAEKAKLRAKAEKELRDAVSEITETIKREVPIYAELPITAEHITDMFKNAAREEFPDLYDWFARLDRADKVAIVKKAMKGIVDERAAKFAARTQTGTKIIEETVTHQTGEPVTPEAIRKRFEELLREELKFRGLVSELDIKRELQSAIAWWHGTRTMPAYFKTAEEMFAEAGAIFMNNPAALAKRAPTFYRTLMNYIERRPEVQKAYDKVQADIKSGVIYKQRVENLRGSWAADAENALERELARKALGPQWRRLKDTFNLAFNKHQGPIQSLARKKLGAPESVKLLSALKDYLYRQTAVEGLARQVNLHVEKPLAQNNLTHDDLSEFMFHKRIVNGDAQQTANSQGFSPNTSAARLEEMQQQLGPKRIGVLHQATEAMRAIYETGPVRLLERSRALKPELMQFIKHNIHYSPFMKARDAFNPLDEGTIAGMLDSAYGQDISAKIFHRTGYLGDIQSPYVALLHKAESLTRFAYRQIALSAMADYMLTHEQDLIMEAPMHFNGNQMVPKVVTNTNIGTLLVMRDGTVKGYYVPRAIWETMENATGVEQMLIGGAMKVLSPFKAILTELNPGFWPVNFFRDLGALGLQMPRGIRSLTNIPRAYKAARATLTGKDDKIADLLLNRLMVISRADPRGEHLGHPDEVNRWLLRMSKHPELWDAETKKISLVIRAWEAWKRQGQILERTVKGAGMMEMDKAYGVPAPDESTPWVSMPEWQKKELVNELAGSPDFNERGRAISIVEVSGGPMFVNAWLRGIESFYKAQKRDPAGVWGKFLLFFGLPALAFFAYEMGWTNFGIDPEKAEDERDMLRSIPERDKLRGFVKTLGWVDKSKGKVAYVVLPFPEQARTLHAMLRKVLQSATGDTAKNLGLASLIQYQGQDLPGKNPVLSEGKKWWDYEVLGQNPYDEFRGRPTLDDDVFLAGEGAHELAKQTVSNLSGGFVTRYRPEAAGDNPTGIEKFLKAPFVSNIAGRWVRVSNAGVAERDAQTTAEVARHQAQLRLVADEILRKNLANEPWTDAEWQLVSVEDYLQQYLVNTMARQAIANGNGPEVKDFMRANTEQRQALLRAWTEREEQRQNRLRNARPQLQAEPLPTR